MNIASTFEKGAFFLIQKNRMIHYALFTVLLIIVMLARVGNEEEESMISPLVKYAMFIFNFLFWVASLALVVIGSWALATKELEGSKRITSAWSFIFDAAFIFIFIGGVAFLIASAGCIGALRENVCLLKTFWICLVLIDFALIILGIVGLAMWNQFVNGAKQKLSVELIRNYDDDPDFKDFMNFVQEEFQCCGLSDNSYQDWSSNLYYNCSKTNLDIRRCGVPHSCCRDWRYLPKTQQNFNCGYNVQDKTAAEVVGQVYTLGCVEGVTSSIHRNILLFCLGAFGVALIPLVSIFLAITLIHQIDNQKDRWYQTRRRVGADERRPKYIVTSA